MKRLIVYALLFAVGIGFAAGLSAVDVRAGGGGIPGPFCRTEIYEPFEYCDPTFPAAICPVNPWDFDWDLYWCQGYWSHTGEPCECVWIGCCDYQG